MNFKSILTAISTDFFEENADLDLEEIAESGLIDVEAFTTKWLGFDPASSADIEREESRLETRLPYSYKQFLLTSNGFRNISLFLDNLLPADKIDWAKNTEGSWWFDLLEQDLIVPDEEYLDYSQSQDETRFRGEYFRHALKISNWDNGMCVFLNPIIKSENEWEILEYATWYPGARRYKSFIDFLKSTHFNNQERIKNFG